MNDFSKKTEENNSDSTDSVRIIALEALLQEAKLKELAAYEVAKEAVTLHKTLEFQFKALERQNLKLKARIKKLQDPDGMDNPVLDWLGKIVVLLKRTGRPMKKREIVQELDAVEGGLARRLLNPGGHISVILSNAVKAGRLKLFPIKGTRGGYYALEEWTGEDGNLRLEMKRKILYW